VVGQLADALRELVLPRLEAVKKSGGGFMARCPVHGDSTASLSVSAGKEHPVVFHCHAGCQPDDIIAKLGLTWADVNTPRERPTSDAEWTPAGPATAVYSYVDETGTLLFQVLRTANKDFRQRIPDPGAKTGWTWKLGDTRRVLYHLPRVIEAVRGGREIYVCEGEKDVHTLEAAGLVATCNPGGAGKWRTEYNEFLRDAIVTIVTDCDDPGRAHARQIREALTDIAACITIVEPIAGKDATDHVNAGHDLAELVTVWSSDYKPKPDLAPDLWEFLATTDDPYDWIVPGLLERGDRLMLTGFEGLGKSMLVRQMAVMTAAGIHMFTSEAIRPARVLLIDCENSVRQSRRKFRPLAGATIDADRRVPDGGLRLIHKPDGIDLTKPQDAEWLIERVTAHQPDVLIIGPFYRLHAGNMNDELPCRRTVAVLDQARTLGNGLALIVEAHAGHAEQGRNRSVRPRGSSLLLGWPEFGFGIAPYDDPQPGQPCRTVTVSHWRGERDERHWPHFLTWGQPWPWINATARFQP
jgi:5S rRNA maturation endonuclease (ribonuclease M5)